MHWRISLLVFCLITLFVRLGFWQLDRAHEKQMLLEEYRHFLGKTPVDWVPGQNFPKGYEPITVHGRFMQNILLLDNQHHQHRFGYHVLSPLVLADGQIILVDRGWIAGDMSRRVFPKIETPLANLTVSGNAYYPSKKGVVLGELFEKKSNQMMLIEAIDIEKISHVLHKSVYPFIIRLNKKASFGFVRDWSIVAMPPQRHYGYALQWFSFAIVMSIIFAVFGIKRLFRMQRVE